MKKLKIDVPQSVGDFSVLPVHVPATPAYDVATVHHLFVRSQISKIPSPDDSQRVFAVNVPIDSSQAHFHALIKSMIGAGRFLRIEHNRSVHGESSGFQTIYGAEAKAGTKRKRGNEGGASMTNLQLETEDATKLPAPYDRALHPSGSNAVLVFVDDKAAQEFLRAVKKCHKNHIYPEWGADLRETQDGGAAKLGLARYVAHHAAQFPGTAAVQASVDAFMNAFNAREEAAAAAARQARSAPDDDGFVTVTRKGGGSGEGGGGRRTGAASMEDAEAARQRELEKAAKKQRDGEAAVGGFYRFQGREQRKAQERDLRRRFEEDRKRVLEMKSRRKGLRPEA